MELPDFIQIPRVIMEDKTLSQLDWAVYGLIYWYSKLKLQKCILSNKAIGDLVNSHEKSVSRSISNLEKRGHIHVLIEKERGNYRELLPLVTYRSHPSNENVTTYKQNGSKSPIQTRTPNNIDLIRTVNKSNTSITPPKKKHSSLSDITQTDIEEIATKYEVPVQFVSLQFEKLRNYCESKGKRYKNYKSALRNFVLGDKQRYMEKLSLQNQPSKRYGFVDLSKNGQPN